MKKILIFSLVYFPKHVGGAEIAIREITDRIPSEDIVFDMVTLRFDSTLPKFERVGNVNVHRIGFSFKNPSIGDLSRFPLSLNKYLFPFLGFLKARSLHSKNPYDGIWAMMANYAGFAALFFKMRFPEVPYLLTLQEGDPIEYIKRRVGFTYRLFERIFTRADFIQTISHYLAKWARDMGYSGNLEVVPNGVDTERFTQRFSKEEIDAVKNNIGKKDYERYMVTTSRLVTKNAVGVVIRAMKFLPESVKFLVLGVGPDEVMLRNLAKEEGVAPRVMFLGQVSHGDMPKYFSVSDVFVRPSRSEGMGNSFIEAMASEIPVVATPVGGIPDFLFDPQKNPDRDPTGLFCEVDNPQSVARQVYRLIEDKGLRGHLVVNAKKLVIEKYGWNIIVRQIRERVFDKLLASR